jgi:hypothetical protein
MLLDIQRHAGSASVGCLREAAAPERFRRRIALFHDFFVDSYSMQSYHTASPGELFDANSARDGKVPRKVFSTHL